MSSISNTSSFDDSLVRLAVALHLEVPLDSVRSEDHLEHDLGLDPLDLVLVVLRLDELVGAQCALADLQQIQTVGDLENMVRDWQDGARQGDVAPSERWPGQSPRETSRTESGTLPIARTISKIRAVG